MPLVSIITPLFNSEAYLTETIDSVREQTFTDWELILIDDCSLDCSREIAEGFAAIDKRVRIICLSENSGAAVARNLGIKEAKGRYIAFLDSDDLWLPTKLERQLAFMEVYDVSFCFGAYKKINNKHIEIGSVGVPSKVSYRDILKVCSIGCLTAMYDTKSLGKIYMPNIRKRQDLGLWLRILKIIPFAYGINEPLAEYRVRSDSISANKSNAAKYTWKLYREVENLNFLSASYYFLFYAVNGVLRTKFPRFARMLGLL